MTREKAIFSFDIKSVRYLVAIIMHTWVHCYFLWIAQEIELNIHMLLHQQQKMIWCKKNEICTPLVHCVKLMQQYQEQSMRVKFPMYQRNFLILIKLVWKVLYHYLRKTIISFNYNIFYNRLIIQFYRLSWKSDSKIKFCFWCYPTPHLDSLTCNLEYFTLSKNKNTANGVVKSALKLCHV